MKKYLLSILSLMLIFNFTIGLTALAAPKEYTKVATIYDAETQLWADSGGSTTGLTIGTEALGNSGQDANDKKEGKYSLWQKVRKGDIAWWHCGDEKYKDQGNPIDVSKVNNLGFQMWLFVSDASAIGGDGNYDSSAGSITIDMGSGSTGGHVEGERVAFWVDAKSLIDGWNLITIQVPKNNDQSKFEKKFLEFNGTRYTVDTTNNNIKFSDVNWIRVMTVAKKQLTFKYDDVKFVDLGSDNPTYKSVDGETVDPTTTTAKTPNGGNETVTPTESNTDPTETDDSNGTITTTDNGKTTTTKKGVTTSSSTSVEGKNKSNTGLIIGLIIAAVVILGGGAAAAYFLVFRKKPEGELDGEITEDSEIESIDDDKE